MSSFKLVHKDSKTQGRLGILKTGHGDVSTPVFMPVGTSGAVKGVTPEHLKQTGASIILANTYHLMLRPGSEIVEKLGGLHKLMSWDGPILTDSGGYQVFSLSGLRKITDEGVHFASHIDGAKYHLNAENAMAIQNQLGADIIMCFDECAPYPCKKAQLEKAVSRTISWAKRCKDAHKNERQLLFGIVQGGVDEELRKHCSQELLKLDFDGYAIGGLSVGEGHDNMEKTVGFTARLLPEERARYLMGVGLPSDIIAAVRAGVDMFDCVLPSRNGRNSFAFTESGPVRMRNQSHVDDKSPIEQGCDCYCCRNFSRGTVRHFFKVKEMLGGILLTIHNISFYQRLMRQIRERIERDEFSDWAQERLSHFKSQGI